MSTNGINYQNCTCEELAGLAQEADLSAFTELVHRHENGLYHFLLPYVAYGYPGQGEDASDLVQQTFIRAYHHLKKYNPTKPFKPWLYTIARRIAVSRYRRLKRKHTAESITGPSSHDGIESGPDQEMIRTEARHNLWELAERALQPRQYQVLWLFYSEELSIKQIGKVMNLNSVHVRVLLHRGRQILAENLTASNAGDHLPEKNPFQDDFGFYPGK